MADNKRVNIINKKDNIILRVTKAYANRLIAENPTIFKFTSKSTLDKNIKREKKSNFQKEIGAKRLAAIKKKFKKTNEFEEAVKNLKVGDVSDILIDKDVSDSLIAE